MGRMVFRENSGISSFVFWERNEVIMRNPIKTLTKKEWILWLGSLAAVIISNIMTGNMDLLTLAATCIGVTALIFAAKGNVWSPILMTVFCILYAVISWRFRYWGEMITYLGMSLPMSVWSVITWAKNSSENGSSVAIQKLTPKHIIGLVIFSVLTTLIFYFILRALNTPNIVFSTISITTSFLAAALTLLRSSYYALGYASNDIVLIILWILASIKNPAYLPVAFNFMIFLVNDLYGFISWKKREAMAFQDMNN